MNTEVIATLHAMEVPVELTSEKLYGDMNFIYTNTDNAIYYCQELRLFKRKMQRFFEQYPNDGVCTMLTNYNYNADLHYTRSSYLLTRIKKHWLDALEPLDKYNICRMYPVPLEGYKSHYIFEICSEYQYSSNRIRVSYAHIEQFIANRKKFVEFIVAYCDELYSYINSLDEVTTYD